MGQQKGLFVTGTDTGVGKTFVTCLLASHLKDYMKVGVMKPAESDCEEVEGQWLPKDALRLKVAAGSHMPLDTICPYALPRLLAPAEAAREAGITIDLEHIKEKYRNIAEASDVVLVEGAGGLLVPLSHSCLYADLVRDLKLPLLIVARAGLGTVNHSLLTVESALSRGIRVIGVLLNENESCEHDASYWSNPRVLQDLASVPVLGPLPHMECDPGAKNAVQEVLREIERLAFS